MAASKGDGGIVAWFEADMAEEDLFGGLDKDFVVVAMVLWWVGGAEGGSVKVTPRFGLCPRDRMVETIGRR